MWRITASQHGNFCLQTNLSSSVDIVENNKLSSSRLVVQGRVVDYLHFVGLSVKVGGMTITLKMFVAIKIWRDLVQIQWQIIL